MKRFVCALLIAAVGGGPPLIAQTRIASDFEIQQMEQQIARSRDFVSQLSGHLNLGDLRATRNENVTARAEFLKALEIASAERVAARKASELTRYATATSYAALAQARLDNQQQAFALSEEAIRYTSDSAKSWNLYASAMSALRQPAKAASASRNAVALATRDVLQSATASNRLDLAIYQYSLAAALIDLNKTAEAERLLTDVVASLRSDTFSALRRDVEHHESFEIYSTARGDEAGYISLLNRAQLRLARIYEDRKDTGRAIEQYRRVLEARIDEPNALSGIARLSTDDSERERLYADAFDANPFSMTLVRDYQTYLRNRRSAPAEQSDTIGGHLRRALQQMQKSELAGARATLDALLQKFPQNDTLLTLRREVDQRRVAGTVVLNPNPTASELRAILTAFQDNRLTAEQRARLDQMQFASSAMFEKAGGTPAPGQTIFETGSIDGVPIRFSEPTAFQGDFAAQTPLRLTYRILGATRAGDAEGLLVEPLRLEPAR